MMLFDAHNHLQDERLRPHEAAIVSASQQAGVSKMVVNGSCEADWQDVLDLAKRYRSLVIPSLGLHPWYISERSDNWKTRLVELLDGQPAAMGEIGLDKWILERPRGPFKTPEHPASLAGQQEAFVFQLRLAAERDLPVSIHCLKAWGPLLQVLKQEPRPNCGFVLHSFGGPKEMIGDLAELGAYFSLPGYFMHERKQRQREAFRHVPGERLLIETDAPDQLLPDDRQRFPLKDKAGKPINHPANLRTVYEFAAELRGVSLEILSAQVERNFTRLFQRLLPKTLLPSKLPPGQKPQ